MLKIISRFKFTFRALKYRNYRLFFTGQSVSLIGMWIQNVAMGWLVYRLTDSASLLGIVGFAENIPVLILSPFAGVMADRWDRRRIFLVTQSLCMLQAFLMSLLIFTNTIQIWHILALSVILGIINAVDSIARQSFWVEIIDDKNDLQNAIALNSTMFNSARLIGPAFAGIIIAFAGEGICFLLNGISYLAVIAALTAMKLTSRKKTEERASLFDRLLQGFKYAADNAQIRYTLLLLSLISFLANPYLVLMPVFAKTVLGGSAEILGYLVGSSGLGALTGAVYIASLKSSRNQMNYISKGALLAGAGFIVFSLSRILAVSLVSVYVIAFGIMMVIAFCNILIQTVVDDDKRGRVMSLHVLALSGMTPFGNLLLGSLSDKIGAPHTFMMVGIIVMAGSVVYKTKSG